METVGPWRIERRIDDAGAIIATSPDEPRLVVVGWSQADVTRGLAMARQAAEAAAAAEADRLQKRWDWYDEHMPGIPNSAT